MLAGLPRTLVARPSNPGGSPERIEVVPIRLLLEALGVERRWWSRIARVTRERDGIVWSAIKLSRRRGLALHLTEPALRMWLTYPLHFGMVSPEWKDVMYDVFEETYRISRPAFLAFLARVEQDSGKSVLRDADGTPHAVGEVQREEEPAVAAVPLLQDVTTPPRELWPRDPSRR